MAARDDAIPGTWPVVIAAYGFFGLLATIALALFAFLTVDKTLSCDRASDTCVVTESRPFWSSEASRFPMSRVASATFRRTGGNATTGGKTSSVLTCAVLTSSDGAIVSEICPEVDAGFVDVVNARLAEAPPAFSVTSEAGVLSYIFPCIPALFSLLPFLGGTLGLIKLRRARLAAV